MANTRKSTSEQVTLVNDDQPTENEEVNAHAMTGFRVATVVKLPSDVFASLNVIRDESEFPTYRSSILCEMLREGIRRHGIKDNDPKVRAELRRLAEKRKTTKGAQPVVVKAVAPRRSSSRRKG